MQSGSASTAALNESVTINDSKEVLSNRLVSKKADCCGCSACASICPVNAIEMRVDVEGFQYPWIDASTCVNCGRCERVCGFKNSDSARKYPIETQVVFSAQHTSVAERTLSSSGGMFFAFAEEILKRGGVVYGCAYDDHFKARHIRCDTLDKVRQCQGSKYVQSSIDNSYVDAGRDLKDGLYVLFTGTPCQVDGLRSYLEVRGIEQDKLLCVDIICHGVPSPRVFSEHISFIQHERNSAVTGYWHRPKDLGWRHEEKFMLKDGRTEIATTLSRLWKRLFYSNLSLRCSCYVCPYTSVQRVGDYTIGDFWGIEKELPGREDPTGVSVLMVNSQKGLTFIESLDSLDKQKCCIENVLPRNPLLVRPTGVPQSRDVFWESLNEEGYSKTVRRYGWYGPVRSLKDYVKRVLGKR